MLSLFHRIDKSKSRGPFIGDQGLRWLKVPEGVTMDRVKEHLDPDVFREARRQCRDLDEMLDEGFKWIDVADASEPSVQTGRRTHEDSKSETALAKSRREQFLRDPSRRRLCLMIEAGTGKSIAMQQVQYLRGSVAGHLTIGLEFAELPEYEADGSLHPRTRMLNFLVNQVCSAVPNSEEAAVRRAVVRAIRSGKATLIVDALDQTSGNKDRIEQARMLADFLHVHPEVSCVVSGRPYSITGTFWNELFAVERDWCFTLIDEFSPQQQIRYVEDERWKAMELIEVAALSQPRLLESVRELEPTELATIRTASELHWTVLKKTLAKSNKGQSSGLSDENIYWLLSLIAYTMVRGPTEIFDGIPAEEFLGFTVQMQDLTQRLPDKDAFRRKYADDGEKLINDIKILGKRNAELQFAFLQDSDETQLYFRSRTLQDFFAAMWVTKYHCEEKDQLWLASVRSSDEHAEFWQLLTEIPVLATGKRKSVQHSIHWVRAIAALFRPIGEENYPLRECQWMYRAWWNLLRTSGLPHAQPFQSFKQPTEHDFNRAVRRLQKEVEAAFETDQQPPDWSSPLPIDAASAAQRVLVDHLREFLAIKAGTLNVPGIPDAKRRALWFWEPSEKSGFVPIDAGEFPMGENRGFRNRQGGSPREQEHLWRIDKPFELHRQPLTQGVHGLFNPNCTIDDVLYPSGDINWYEAWCVATWLHGYLPTEQQWKRACRGRVEPDERTFFWTGGSIDDLRRKVLPRVRRVALSDDPRYSVLESPAGEHANDFGLYNMHGLVAEWTASWYSTSASDATEQKNARFRSSLRVLRGGSFYDDVDDCRPVCRDVSGPELTCLMVGLRVARA